MKINSITIRDNGQCEIRAKKPDISPDIKEFWVMGDSNLAIDCITSGRIYGYKQHSKYQNSTLWLRLRQAIEECIEHGCVIHFVWIPQKENMQSDELCNAALDGRAIDKSKQSDETIDTTNISDAIVR